MTYDFQAFGLDEKKPTVIAKPVISAIYTADPAASVGEDGRLYVYASHDMDPPRGCDCMDRYHVYSTGDMVHFRDEGEILRSDEVTWGRPEGGFMWAPDCKYKNGTYYFYYPHPSESRWNDTWKIGVAVSKSPCRDFHDMGYIEGIGGWCMIDPSIFIDDNGINYLYFGGGAMPRAVILEDDMMTVKDGTVYEMEGLEDFHEASYVFKRNGLYYMTYSDNLGGNNRMHYAVSDSPLGPWDHRGIYLTPTGCDTSHGSVVRFKDRWYCFYHNCVISGGRGNLRSVCVDELFFDEDGDILPVVQTAKPLDPVGPDESLPADTPYVPASSAVRLERRAEIGEDGSAKIEKGRNLIFTKLDGMEGGRVSLHFVYESTAPLSHLRLIVNDTDWSYVNLAAGYNTAAFTVPMRAGKVNTVRLEFTDGEGTFRGFYTEALD